MSQRGLIYSFVAKGTVVLAEHTQYTGNFSTIAVQCLQKLPSNSSKYTYSCDGHTFNFLIDNGFGICFYVLLPALLIWLSIHMPMSEFCSPLQFSLLLLMSRLEGVFLSYFLNGWRMTLWSAMEQALTMVVPIHLLTMTRTTICLRTDLA